MLSVYGWQMEYAAKLHASAYSANLNASASVIVRGNEHKFQ